VIQARPRPVDLALFDAGGVLLLPEVTEAIEALCNFVPVSARDLDRAHYAGMAAVDEEMRHMQLGPGGLTGAMWAGALRDRYRSAKLEALGIAGPCPPPLEPHLFESPWTRVAPGSIEILRAIGELGISIAVVSNAAGTVEAELKAAGICQVGAGEGVCVAAVIDSTVVGVAKPDPRIFSFALEATAIGPERGIFIGDSVAIDLHGATLAGIRGVHFDPYGFCAAADHQDLDDLRDLIPMLR
jgi:putative hydrolase of the HAD superfamily